MLWIRGLIFTILVPFMVGVMAPRWLDEGGGAADGSHLGWLLIVPSALFYLSSLLRFLTAGGTPSIYFARPLRFLIGEEPPGLVERGPYRFTRNPMYVSVVAALLGQALLYRSWAVALYGLLLWPWLHLVVIVFEEPHLRKKIGPAYEDYCRRVPRWFGRPK